LYLPGVAIGKRFGKLKRTAEHVRALDEVFRVSFALS
jgi:hypothetical protein